MRIPRYSNYGPIADQKGIQLYHVNFATWEEIIHAETKSLIGYPYIIIKRNKGFIRRWSIPLYLGFDNFKESIEQHCPHDHVIYSEVMQFKEGRYQHLLVKLPFVIMAVLVACFLIPPLWLYFSYKYMQ